MCIRDRLRLAHHLAVRLPLLDFRLPFGAHSVAALVAPVGQGHHRRFAWGDLAPLGVAVRDAEDGLVALVVGLGGELCLLYTSRCV